MEPGYYDVSRDRVGPATSRPLGPWAALILLIVAVWALSIALDPPKVTYDEATCQEDETCWVWSTMGDHRRSVVLKNGEERIVGPCGYARLAKSGSLSPYTMPMKGDATARRKGCL